MLSQIYPIFWCIYIYITHRNHATNEYANGGYFVWEHSLYPSTLSNIFFPLTTFYTGLESPLRNDAAFVTRLHVYTLLDVYISYFNLMRCCKAANILISSISQEDNDIFFGRWLNEKLKHWVDALILIVIDLKTAENVINLRANKLCSVRGS